MFYVLLSNVFSCDYGAQEHNIIASFRNRYDAEIYVKLHRINLIEELRRKYGNNIESGDKYIDVDAGDILYTYDILKFN